MKSLRPTTALALMALLLAPACAVSPDGDSSADGESAGSVSQELRAKGARFTWTIETRSDGWYAPTVVWHIKQPYSVVQSQYVAGGAFGPGVTLEDLHDGTTNAHYPRLDNAYIDRVVSTTVAAWASIANIQFTRVNSAKADIVFRLPLNGPDSCSIDPASTDCVSSSISNVGEGWQSGRTVNVNMMYRKEQAGAFWAKDEYIPQDLDDATHGNDLLRVEMHELGHRLGFGHAFDDASYGRNADGTEKLCGGAHCANPPSLDDLSIMDYNLWTGTYANQGPAAPVLFSQYDIDRAQAVYGAPRVSPILELQLPTGEHFYTRAWPEANHVLHHTYNSGGTRFLRVVGGLYTRGMPAIPARTGFDRYYDASVDGHTYVLATAPTPAGTYEGRMGYVSNLATAFLSQLRTYRVDATGDERFFRADETIPPGHTDTGARYGFVVKNADLNRVGPLDDDGFYRLINRRSGKTVEIAGNSTVNGAVVQQWDWTSGKNQQFRFSGTGDNYYAVFGRASGLAFDVSGGSTSDGAKVQQWTYGEGNNQEWLVEGVGNGYWRLRPRHSGACLTNKGSSSNNGNPFVQQACVDGNVDQHFQILKVDQNWSSGYYQIINRTSGKALDVAGASQADGAIVQQWTPGSGDNQRWTFVSGRLQAKHSDKQVGGSGSTDGTKLKQVAAGSGRTWTMKAASSGYFNFVDTATGKCLDVPGASTADGAQLQLWTCNGNGAQDFSIVRVE